MKKSYVFTNTVNFSVHDFYALAGDQGLYDAGTQQLNVYRSGNLVSTFNTPAHSIASMVDLKWMQEEGVPVKASKEVKKTGYEEYEETRISLTEDIDLTPAPGFEGLEIAETPGDRVIDETPEPEAEKTKPNPSKETIQVFSDEDDEDVTVIPMSLEEDSNEDGEEEVTVIPMDINETLSTPIVAPKPTKTSKVPKAPKNPKPAKS